MILKDKISKYPIWLATYSLRCPMEDKFDMWQYSNKGQVIWNQRRCRYKYISTKEMI